MVPQNCHKGKRCFLIASGPSVKYMNLDHLRKEVVICVNESYKALSWEPDYICTGDKALWPKVKSTYAKMSSKIVCSSGTDGTCGKDYSGSNLVQLSNLDINRPMTRYGFSYDLTKPVRKAYNVVLEIALPFICWCGFSECYLIGCDCTNSGYFYNDPMRGEGHQKVVDEAIRGFDLVARSPLPTKVYNAGLGGKLYSFPRVSYSDIFEENKPTDSELLVIGYYTPDRNYSELCHDMQASAQRYGMQCEIECIPSAYVKGVPKPMPWVMNCALCGPFIKSKMDKYPDRRLLYLDADATVMRRPDLIIDGLRTIDFAAPILTNKFVQNELVSNTLYFNSTAKAKELVDVWCRVQAERNKAMLGGKYKSPYKEAWDQKVLQDSLSTVDGLRWEELPWEYAKITTAPSGIEIMPGVPDPVICQHQASRQNKAKV